MEIQLDQVNDRLGDRQMHLEVTPAAKEWLAERGFEPAFGARPLKRLIQREVLDRLARLVLSGDLRDGKRSSSTPTAMTCSSGQSGARWRR